MTLSEFKAWFEGFTDNIDSLPTEKQWAKIQKRVKDITGVPVTERIFVDRYAQGYPRFYWNNDAYVGNDLSQMLQSQCSQMSNANLQNAQSYNSANAMYALGKFEREEVA